MAKRILCFGDSNTWGAIPGETSRYPDNIRWTGVLAQALGDGYTVIEEGYNGRTTVFDDPVEGRLSGIRYFGPCLDSQSPLDLVVLMLGTNDLKARFGVDGHTIAGAFDRYMDVLRTVPMAGERPKVLLMSPIHIDPSYEEATGFLDMFGPNAAERSKRLAKPYKIFAEANGLFYFNAADHAVASTRDGIHMEAAEHRKLGLALAERIKAILG